MLRMTIPVAVFLIPMPLLAQAAEPARVEIDLSSFQYEPATIAIDHGRPYVLHLVNKSGKGHDFVAKLFSLPPLWRTRIGRGRPKGRLSLRATNLSIST